MRRAVWSIFQNPDDLALFERLGLAHAERSVLIRGSGVDVDDYRPTTVPRADPPKALLVARMLKTKGVEEFYRAARILKERGVAVRFELVGAPDPQNPASLDEATLRRWDTEGIVRWRGPVDDVRPALAEAAMAVLPSYREGLPKALIEAAACGLPMVAFDVPGCREIVRHDRTGLLVPLYDAEALADAIERLAVDPALRSTMGEAARAMAVAEFSQASVTRRTLDLYEKALAERDRS
jgi:glycosyltransferase involved in cell wall biosynthesis